MQWWWWEQYRHGVVKPMPAPCYIILKACPSFICVKVRHAGGLHRHVQTTQLQQGKSVLATQQLLGSLLDSSRWLRLRFGPEKWFLCSKWKELVCEHLLTTDCLHAIKGQATTSPHLQSILTPWKRHTSPAVFGASWGTPCNSAHRTIWEPTWQRFNCS